MSEKRIENQFQKTLGEYASMIDEDQLWSEIESRVPKNKKKKRILVWFAFGLPLMLLVVIGFWLVKGESILYKNLYKNGPNAIENIAKNTNSNLGENEIEAFAKVKSQKESNESITTDRITPTNASNTAYSKRSGKDQVEEVDEIGIGNEGNDLKGTERNNHMPLKLLEGGNTEVKNDPTNDLLRRVSIASIPNIEFLSRILISDFKEIKSRKNKRSKRIVPQSKKRSFIGLNYYAGQYHSKENRSSQDSRFIDFGDAYFSQGLSVSYNRFIVTRLYGKVLLSADRSYKKYSDVVQRDTLVPSSTGDQIIAYNEYLNGVIDTESGLPIVKGVYNRDVLYLNTISTFSIGLGLGYLQPIGRWNLNVEADVQRSILYNLSGFGREGSSRKIENLENFENYFSIAPKYTINAQLSVDYSLNKSILITAGMQYQRGLSSLLIEQSMHSEKVNLIRGLLGLKKIL